MSLPSWVYTGRFIALVLFLLAIVTAPFAFLAEPRWDSLASNLLASWVTAGVTIFCLDVLLSGMRRRAETPYHRALRGPLRTTITAILMSANASGPLKELAGKVSSDADALLAMAQRWVDDPESFRRALASAKWEQIDSLEKELADASVNLRGNLQLAQGALLASTLTQIADAAAALDTGSRLASLVRANGPQWYTLFPYPWSFVASLLAGALAELAAVYLKLQADVEPA